MTFPQRAAHPDDATLADYQAGMLSSQQSDVVTDHVAGCARCQTTLVEMERADGVLRSLPLLDPPGDMRQRVLHKVERPERPWLVQGQGLGRVAVVGVIVILLLAVSFGLLRSTLGADHSSSGPQIAAPAAPTRMAAASLAPGAVRRGAPTALARSAVGSASLPTAVPTPRPARNAHRGADRPLPKAGIFEAVAPSEVGVTASIDLLTTKAMGTTAAAARRVTVLYGGAITSAHRLQKKRTVLTVRVPAARFQTVLDSLAALPGTRVKSKATYRRDLTRELTALRAQATKLHARQTRLRAALKIEHGAVSTPTTRGELGAVEKSLAIVQSRIDVDNQSVASSTIVLSIVPA